MKTTFFNTDTINVSTHMNEYLKKNFGYTIEGDFESLREAKANLEAQKREMKPDFMNSEYTENMLMLETIKALLKAHQEEVSEGKYKSDAQRKAVHAAKKESAPAVDVNTTKYENSYNKPEEVKMDKVKLEESLLDQLNALLEGDAAEAEITMAARGIVDDLQDVIEKLGKIQNDQIGPLADEMAYSHGPEQAQSFKASVDDAISGLLGQARSAKDAVADATLVLSGEKSGDDMSSDVELGGDMGDDMEADISADVDDEIAGDISASGEEGNPLGREKRD